MDLDGEDAEMEKSKKPVCVKQGHFTTVKTFMFLFCHAKSDIFYHCQKDYDASMKIPDLCPMQGIHKVCV